jgi:hypothetical protein
MLPEPYREQAIDNYALYSPAPSTRKVPSAYFAVSDAFIWHYTPEGDNYWNALCARLQNGTLTLTERVPNNLPEAVVNNDLAFIL